MAIRKNFYANAEALVHRDIKPENAVDRMSFDDALAWLANAARCAGWTTDSSVDSVVARLREAAHRPANARTCAVEDGSPEHAERVHHDERVVIETAVHHAQALLEERTFQLDEICTWLASVGRKDAADAVHAERDRFLLPTARKAVETLEKSGGGS